MLSRLVPSLIAITVLAGCGDPPAPATIDTGDGSPATAAQADSRAGDSAPAPAVPKSAGPKTPDAPAAPAKPVTLDEDTLKSWITAMTAIRETSAGMSKNLGQNPNALQSYLASMGASKEWQDAITDQGLTMASFQEISNQVSQALVALMMDDQQGSVQGMLQGQLDAMKNVPGVTEAQLDKIRAGIAKSKTQIGQISGGATEETKALIKKYRAQIEATFQ